MAANPKRRITLFAPGLELGGKVVILADTDTSVELLGKAEEKFGRAFATFSASDGSKVEITNVRTGDVLHVFVHDGTPDCPPPAYMSDEEEGTEDMQCTPALEIIPPNAPDGTHMGQPPVALLSPEEYPAMNDFVLREYARDLYDEFDNLLLEDPGIQASVFNSLMIPLKMREKALELIRAEEKRVLDEIAAEFQGPSPGAVAADKASEAFALQLLLHEQDAARAAQEAEKKDAELARTFAAQDEQASQAALAADEELARRLAEEAADAPCPVHDTSGDAGLARCLAEEAPPVEKDHAADATIAALLAAEEEEAAQAATRDAVLAAQLHADTLEEAEAQRKRAKARDAEMAKRLHEEEENRGVPEGVDQLPFVRGGVDDLRRVVPHVSHNNARKYLELSRGNLQSAVDMALSGVDPFAAHPFRCRFGGSLTKPYQLVEVQGWERQEVLELIDQVNRSNITRVERVENPDCMERYGALVKSQGRSSGFTNASRNATKRQKKRQRRPTGRVGTEPNTQGQGGFNRFGQEHWAFHGCRMGADAYRSILTNGLDKAFARVGGCIWLAADSAYSMGGYQHADEESGGKVFVCLVASALPVCKPIRGVAKHTIWNVYDNDAVYVAYVVTLGGARQ